MKITLSRTFKQAASALLTTMVLGGILCLFVVYYLSLIEQQSRLSARSQAWNMAITVTEAGIEEGLEELQSATLNLTTDPLWSFDGTSYWRTNTMADGNSYTVSIDVMTDPFHPTVVARSYIVLPKLAMNAPPVFFAAVGVSTAPASVNRAVKVRTARGSLFIKGLVAKHLIDMNGNDVSVDSFDSRDLWHSWFGHYQTATAKDNGDVATNDSVVDGIGVNNANIYGHAATGPGGSVAVGNQGGVGAHSWQASHPGQIEPGWFADNSNFTFPEPSMPYTNGLPPVGPQTIPTTVTSITSSNKTSSTYPSPVPWSGVATTILTTNTTTSGYPAAGTYLGSVTQNFLTNSTTTVGHPAAGTYLGTIQTNYNGNSQNIKNFTYWLITGTNYNYSLITGTNYTYALYTTNVMTLTNTYDHVIPTSGDYYVDSLSGNTIVLAPNVRLVIGSGLSMKGNDTFVVAPGASVQVYSGGTSCTVGGNGVINQSGFAANFVLTCMNTVTSFTFNGNGEFTGVLCAPDAHFTMNGGGKVNTDYIGALVCDSVTFNGHFSFHYDEALGANQGNGRMLITSWDEIP